jgi:hypothetical protein
LFFGVTGVLFEQLALDLFGDFEGEELVGMLFDTIFEIAECLSWLHFEGVEFLLGVVELSANVLEIFVGAFRRRHGESVSRGKTVF